MEGTWPTEVWRSGSLRVSRDRVDRVVRDAQLQHIFLNVYGLFYSA